MLLGASSLDDMLGRMDASDRVSEQDSLVLKQVGEPVSRPYAHQSDLLGPDVDIAVAVATESATRPIHLKPV